MAYGVISPVAVAATNIDSYNRSAISASALENGSVVNLLTKSATAGESELWVATATATGELDDVWMAYDPEVVWTGSYRGLDPDVRNYTIAIGRTFSAFKLMESDLILMSEDAFTGSKSTNTYANATNGQSQLVWGASQTANVISLKYIATEYFSIGTGAMDNQRFTAYLMEVQRIART